MFEEKNTQLSGKRVLVLGRSFKEDCPDTRNSKTFWMMDYLWAQGAEVYNFDPIADDDHFEGGRGTVIVEDPFDGGAYHAIIATLEHTVFRQQMDLNTLKTLVPQGAPLVDIRGQYDCEEVHDHFDYWRP